MASVSWNFDCPDCPVLTLCSLQELEETGSVGRGSPVQQELEDSETEAVWSDGDLNLVANGT